MKKTAKQIFILAASVLWLLIVVIGLVILIF
nr:MAG TPA: hypothetical protein [Caudoviricetes sp.]